MGQSGAPGLNWYGHDSCLERSYRGDLQVSRWCRIVALPALFMSNGSRHVALRCIVPDTMVSGLSVLIRTQLSLGSEDASACISLTGVSMVVSIRIIRDGVQ